nr:spore germination protein [Lihuaxuella thermophila]
MPADAPVQVYPSLNKNFKYVEEMFFHAGDLKKRSFQFNEREGMLIYLETVADAKKIQREILRPVLETRTGNLEAVISSPGIRTVKDLSQVVEELARGCTVLFMQGEHRAVIVETSVLYKRGMSEPDNESVVRGSHQGFIENLSVNLYQIRRSIPDPHLTVRYFKIGTKTKTRIAMVYMRDLANPEMVQEVEKRLRSIRADTIISPGFLTEYMEDTPFSPFPQTLYTERPDRTVSNIMEGRVAILSEGDPTAVIVPVTLFAFYQSTDDYHSRWIIGSFVRIIRLVSFMIAFQLPAVYIGVVSFHPEVLPVNQIFTVKGSLQRVPFPSILEALFMELTIELIREAGIRLPSRVGQTIGIVGGLVIGDAVVRAGLVSYPMIIVVAVTAISSFLVPSNEMSITIRILRFPLMVLAATFGFIGINLGMMWVLMHLCQLESFGTPYFAPVMPMRIKDLKDTFIRVPIWKLNERPHDPHPQQMQQEQYSRGWKSRGRRKK